MNPILIVDDEAAIAMLVRRILTEAGYRCQAVTDSRAAANLLEKNRYDLVLLDVMMPYLDGYDLLAYLRPTGTPCIFITAKDAVAERVRGLNSGADDYIVKPFDNEILHARIQANLRRWRNDRQQKKTVNELRCASFTLNAQTHELTKTDGTCYPLVPMEFKILAFLMQHAGQCYKASELYNHIWGKSSYGDHRTVVVHIHNLRKKIEQDPAEPQLLQSVWGKGYCFIDENPQAL